MKLVHSCMHHLLEDTNPIIVKMYDLFLERINRLIKTGGALTSGLRRFEFFLFDKECYEVAPDDEEKMAPEARKMRVYELYQEGIADKTILERIEHLIRDTKICNA